MTTEQTEQKAVEPNMIDRHAVEHQISVDLTIKQIDNAIEKLLEARNFRIYQIMEYLKKQ